LNNNFVGDEALIFAISREGNSTSLRVILHIPFDLELFAELKMERYELSKSGTLLFNHPQSTNDDKFWVSSFAVQSKNQLSPVI